MFGSFFNDAFIHRLVSLAQTNVATSAYRPCVLYLNGEYWGVYGLREHYDEDYLEYTFGVDSDDVIYIDKSFSRDTWETEDIIKTDNIELGKKVLSELYEFLGCTENSDGTYTLDESKDWSSDETYNEFCEIFDVESLIDYILIQGYIGNTDFGGNNFRMWRTVPEPTKSKTKKSKYADGKWRFMLHDTDFGLITPEIKVLENYFAYSKHTLILNRAVQNEKFKKQMLARASYIQDTVFNAENSIKILEEMKNELAPLYEYRIKRWGLKDYTFEVWLNIIEMRMTFLRERPNYFLDDIKSAFGITEE